MKIQFIFDSIEVKIYFLLLFCLKYIFIAELGNSPWVSNKSNLTTTGRFSISIANPLFKFYIYQLIKLKAIKL